MVQELRQWGNCDSYCVQTRVQTQKEANKSQKTEPEQLLVQSSIKHEWEIGKARLVILLQFVTVLANIYHDSHITHAIYVAIPATSYHLNLHILEIECWNPRHSSLCTTG